MISYGESLKILEQVSREFAVDETEDVTLLESVGRVLAEDLRARENNPPFDNSAMDGFALNTSVVLRDGEWAYWIPVRGLIGAGDGEMEVDPAQGAVEIMTGAPLPSSCFDSVVRIEDVEIRVDENGQKFIKLRARPVVSDNIRRAGEDTRVGDFLLEKGERISCQHILVLATQGISSLKVKRQLQIGILSTGKEIVRHETKEISFGQIRNSTGVYLEAALNGSIFRVRNYGIAEDDPKCFIDIVEGIFEGETDILISTGAVSMGVFDFVRPALESLGAKIYFHKCAIRPGKPILFASLERAGKTRFIFGVPGNPVSTMVGLQFFIKPFIDGLLQSRTEKPIAAALIADAKKPEGLRCFFKAKVSMDGPRPSVESLNGQASFMVSPLLKSNAWVVFPEQGSIVSQGTSVEVFHQ